MSVPTTTDYLGLGTEIACADCIVRIAGRAIGSTAAFPHPSTIDFNLTLNF